MTSSWWFRAPRLIAFSCCALGCAEETATQVVVQLHVEPALAAEATRLFVVVEGNEGSPVLEHEKLLDGKGGRIARIPLIPRGSDPTRRFVVRAELSDAGGAVLGRVEAHAGYTERELRSLNLWFSSSCKGKECGPNRTCHRGVCRGACFETADGGGTEPTPPSCRECEQCLGGCEPADGASCGCAGETCSGSDCVPNDRVSFVAAAFKHTCAALSTGEVYCWGISDGFGRLGLGADAESATPLLVPGIVGSEGVVASGNHSCALSPASRYCWGENDVGQLGTGTTTATAYTTPIAIDNSGLQLTTLSIGFQHTCGVTQDSIWCWGKNVNGELGIGSATLAEPEPKLVGSGYAHVSVGAEHTCGLRNDGALECWGHNESLQVGVPAGVTIATPMRPGCDSANAGDRCFSDWTRVGVGAFHSCAIRQSRRMYCWGSNRDGQLGIGPSLGSEDTVEPQLVVGDTQWSDVSGGSHHSCGLDLDGTLHCWGKNESRQLGIADVGFVSTPARVEVYAPAGFRSLSLGENHSCAIRDDRTLWCWGRNVEGQIGIGAKSDMPVEQPTRVCF